MKCFGELGRIKQYTMNNINIDQFKQLDIRIGTVIKAEVPEWSHWVMKLTVDFGGVIASEDEVNSSKAKSSQDCSSRRVRIEPKSREVKSGGGDEIGNRTIFAGIMHFFKPEDLIGKQFPFIINLEKKKIGPEGDFSEGMMMAADLILDDPIKIGDEEVKDKPVLLTPMEKVPNGTPVQ